MVLSPHLDSLASASRGALKTLPGGRRFWDTFGPLSLIFLLAFWALSLVFGFALVQYGAGEHVHLAGETVNFWTVLYMSGETFFTLGLGDVTPVTAPARVLNRFGIGHGICLSGGGDRISANDLFSIFAARNRNFSDGCARRFPADRGGSVVAIWKLSEQTLLDDILQGWERWSAEILESHLSYPVLSFFRSQHNNQSWLGALTATLDTSALVITGVDRIRIEQAKLTFAAARHAVVDLAQVVNARYDPTDPDRLPPEDLLRLRQRIGGSRSAFARGPEAEQKFKDLRIMYEPYAARHRAHSADFAAAVDPFRKTA